MSNKSPSKSVESLANQLGETSITTHVSPGMPDTLSGTPSVSTDPRHTKIRPGNPIPKFFLKPDDTQDKNLMPGERKEKPDTEATYTFKGKKPMSAITKSRKSRKPSNLSRGKTVKKSKRPKSKKPKRPKSRRPKTPKSRGRPRK